jgi:hypothetical protein
LITQFNSKNVTKNAEPVPRHRAAIMAKNGLAKIVRAFLVLNTSNMKAGIAL